MATKRLTWNEICEMYPNQSVALTDIERSNSSTIISAIVIYSETGDHMSSMDIASKALLSNGSIIAENTSDSLMCAGASVIC